MACEGPFAHRRSGIDEAELCNMVCAFIDDDANRITSMCIERQDDGTYTILFNSEPKATN